jgi:CheY-like chemotaxis protein
MNTPITIFYTDDDKEDLNIFSEAVKALETNIQLLTMNHGDQLINALNAPPPSPHIIFLDLNMPGKSGFQLLKEIKDSQNHSNYPVVIFTTSDDPRSISITRDLGANLYITKPNSFPALQDAIRYSITLDWNRLTPDDYVYTGKLTA